MHIYSFNDLKFTLKHLKRSYMFRSYDHPQETYVVHWVFLNYNFNKEQCMRPEDDRMIETCRIALSVLMWILDHSMNITAFVGVLTLWRLTTPIVVVPHRWPLNVALYTFIQQIQVLNILNIVYTVRFFFSSKCSLFHNSNEFCSCFIHILCTECAKIKKIIIIIPAPKG